MRKRFLGLLGALCALALAVGLMPARALADDATLYVALGDSITAGYGLAEGEESFPELVAQERGYELTNLASNDGVTSETLLGQLSDESVASADVITITVGGNDLMDALYAYLADEINSDPVLSAALGNAMTPEFVESMLASSDGMADLTLVNMLKGLLAGFPASEQATEALAELATNVGAAVTAIKTANPDATIVLVNQYNPYGSLAAEELEDVVAAFDQGVQAMNQGFSAAEAAGWLVADAYGAFEGAESNPCNAAVVDLKTVNLDFHPNAYGHQLIAQAVADVLPETPEEPETPAGPDWVAVATEVAAAESGSTVTVDMEGTTVVPSVAFQALAGRDAKVRFDIAPGISWTVDGVDVPTDAKLLDLDLGVELGTTTIPENAVGLISTTVGVAQVTLAHDGEFGFELTLEVALPVPEGPIANAYRYEEATGRLLFEGSAPVAEGGVVSLTIDHASQWLVSLDSRSHELAYPDAIEGQWYSEAVRWASLTGAMTGYGDGTFAPGRAVLRCEAATVLWRLAGEPDADASALPADVPAGEWYAGAAAWALGEGVFNGSALDGSFVPAGELSREQAACVLYNRAEAAGEDVSARADLSGFSDAGELSGWAAEAMGWAVAEGIFNGGEGRLEPTRALTRAELCAVLMNWELAS